MQTKTNQLLDQIADTMRSDGERFTPQRRDVMRLLLEQNRPLKAYDIAEKLGDIKPMSVYRALDFLAGKGLAHRIESLNAYAACIDDHCQHRDSHYMICSVCEDVREIHSHDLNALIDKTVSNADFKVDSRVIEVRGTCARCLG